MDFKPLKVTTTLKEHSAELAAALNLVQSILMLNKKHYCGSEYQILYWAECHLEI